MNEHTPTSADGAHLPEPAPTETSNGEAEVWESEADLAKRYCDEAAQCFIRGIKYPDGSEPRSETSLEVRVEFEAAYIGSFTDRDAFVEHLLDQLGWDAVLASAIRQGGIPRDALAWDYDEIYAYLSRYHRIFTNEEGVLHIFGIPEARPLAPEQPWRGGRS